MSFFNNLRISKNSTTIWLTGLSGAGKTTLANALKNVFASEGKRIVSLDGDDVRKGLNKDLGFSTLDRNENIRRVAEVAKLFNKNGEIVICSFICPTKETQDIARQIIGEENFVEIYVNTPLSVCEKRDVKGMYKKARSGKMKNFTGIDSVYEPPENPHIVVTTVGNSIKESLDQIIQSL